MTHSHYVTVSGMKTLVTYVSSSGNTRKVAEAAYDGLKGEKEIKPIKDIDDLNGYDLVFLGFPVVGEGAPGKVKRFLATKAKGKRVAMLVTHGMPASNDAFGKVIPRCRAAATGSDLEGIYECQGQMVSWLPKVLRLHPYSYVRAWARMGGDQHGVGHPDHGDLDGARVFAGEMESKLAQRTDGCK